ncbi:hypothetical protein NWE55_00930 [Myroides albus]|uniref:Uncharacterized protein n=1 Tax=Myroides albus TaxID=2562892 RepID=A0A6I3LR77_9FLAO|nr:hypothetical protein [Myroides albus]MTG99181.1 hypothetical protein [Myroides albus]UVD79887.1 hypothetical protein NWE55_00930 [Myroides albus]
MKLNILPMLFLLGTITTQAQIGIGTELPHPSVQLEVQSTKKGVLIPRVTLSSDTDITTIDGAPYPESLIVYHLGTPSLDAGFYCWEGKKWNTLVSNATIQKYIASSKTRAIRSNSASGEVRVEQNGDDYIFHWKDENNLDQHFSISSIVNNLQNLTSLSSSAEEGKAQIIYKDEKGDKTTIDLTDILKKSTVFEKYIIDYVNQVSKEETITEIVPDVVDNVRTGVYYYYNEKRDSDPTYVPTKLNVIGDVATNFGKLLEVPNVKSQFDQYFKRNQEDAVTYFGGKFYVTKKDNNNYQDFLIIASDIEDLKETNTELSAIVDRDGKYTGRYKYVNEEKEVFTFDIVQDVIENSKTIFEQKLVKDEIIKLIEKEEGEVSIKEEKGKVYITWKSDSGEIEQINLTDIVTGSETLTSLKVVGQEDGVILTYKDEDSNESKFNLTEMFFKNPRFKESMMEEMGAFASLDLIVSKLEPELNDDGEHSGVYNFYNKKDEDGEGVPTVITVVEDVKNNFQDVLKDNKVQEQLKKFTSQNTEWVENSIVYKDDTFYEVVRKQGNLELKEIKINNLVETDTSIEEIRENGEFTGKYNYISESGKKYEIDLVQSFIDGSYEVFTAPPMKSLLEYIVSDIEEKKLEQEGYVKAYVRSGELGFIWKGENGLQESKFLPTWIREMETVTAIDVFNTPDKKTTKLTFKDENADVHEFDLSKLIAESYDFQDYIKELIDGTFNPNDDHLRSANTFGVNEKIQEDEVVGKWIDKDLLRYAKRLNVATDFNVVEFEKEIGGLIVNFQLINETTNAVTRDLLHKKVNNGKTYITVNDIDSQKLPAGSYYVVIDYVK